MIKLFFVLIIAQTISAQQDRYFIFFKEKDESSFNKSSLIYNEILNSLSDKSIERRIKHRGEENILAWEDIPIISDYIYLIEQTGAVVYRKLNWFNAVSVYADNVILEKIKSFEFVKEVRRVNKITYKEQVEIKEENTRFSFHKINNNDLDYGGSFNQLNLSDIPQVHAKGIIGKNVRIGVLDTGFDWQTHESLNHINVIGERDFIFNDSITANEPGDAPGQHNHGTYVLSIVGGLKDSMLIGAAFGSSFLLAKTEDIRSEKNIEEDNYAAALEWMEALGVDITTSSLGYNEFDPGETSYTYADMNGNTTIVTKAVENAFNVYGIVTITSAGNEGNKPWKYITAPADGFNIIAVGAVDFSNNLASFSSRGPTSDGRIKPEITTQGVSVFGATAGFPDKYGSASGTSCSAPIAAGITALLLEAFPHLSNKQVRSIIIQSGYNAGNPNNDRGYGLLSAVRALSFPNAEAKGDSLIIRKIFFDEDIQNLTATLHYSFDGNEFVQINSVFDTLVHQFYIPNFDNNDEIIFYLTYQRISGDIITIPGEGRYFKKLAGSNLIEANQTFNQSELKFSNSYPNPFIPNLHKNVIVKLNGAVKSNVIVYNSMGEHIRDLEVINNRIIWDGKNNHGINVSSGVYLISVVVNDEIITKKLILLN